MDNICATVAALKAEGNALYTAGNFQEAYSKYSEAIQLDGGNAVLYANRAAASMALKEIQGNLSAVFDLRKAVQIDVSYTKAWARLASIFKVFHMHELSISAAEYALSCLDKEGLSPAEMKLKDQCEQTLRGSMDESKMEQHVPSLRDTVSPGVKVVPAEVAKSGRLPWDNARAMRDMLTEDRVVNSSAWLILEAHDEFAEGVKLMHQLRWPQGDGKASGSLMALSYITNAVLRDERAFFISAPDFLQKLDMQVTFEEKVLRNALGNCPWTGSKGDISTLQSQITNLIEQKGWDVARRALSNTVRIWVLNGLLALHLSNSPSESLRLYANALSTLEWGMSKWEDVLKEDRGVIFERTFIRGVRCLCMGAYHSNDRRSHIGEEGLQKLKRLAQDVLDDIDAHPADSDLTHTHSAGFLIAFKTQPKAIAHVSLGLIHWKTAMHKSTQQKSRDENLAQALSHYRIAIDCSTADDEQRLYWETNVFEIMIEQEMPIERLLLQCQVIRELIPVCGMIWEKSAAWDTILQICSGILESEKSMYQGLLDQAWTLDDSWAADMPIRSSA
ncbi:hypothetical protein CERSUDRAFT_90950 [Gelatoporia subvermispora B]|uniref:Uncharacterized protein n=1 Tax=Ceriporiopsis subvermispora (strain B) TaxID=914234 RepID=M2QYU4_CERS8|nr:hypothetical protein CERSUDRAFT_90950 [Gelatoporia subvermispora B]